MGDVTGAAHVATWLAHRMPIGDEEHRAELTASVTAALDGRPRCERAVEAASLAGLWLRLWGRHEGGDEAARALRQGVYLGAVIVAFAASVQCWRALDAMSGGLPAVAALSASLAAALAAGGHRPSAVVAMACSAAALAAAGTAPALGVVAAVGLLAGERFGGRRCSRGLAAGLVVAGVLAVAAAFPPETAFGHVVGTGVPIALVVLPAALAAVGWFDPRFAVAAAIAWLGAAVALGGASGAGAFVLVAALPAAIIVSHLALRRTFAV